MMASACINNVRMSPEDYLDRLPAFPSHGLISPRISFSRDFAGDEEKIDDREAEEGNVEDLVDFEFRIDDPITMLPADELFSNGKLLPLHLVPVPPAKKSVDEIRPPERICSGRRVEIGEKVFASSPKAPICSSRLKELLRLRKMQSPKIQQLKDGPATSSKRSSSKSLKHRRSSSNSDSFSCSPLLSDYNSESLSNSARASLSSSSSSGADNVDLPRLSLDSDRSLRRYPPHASVTNGRSLAFRRQPSDLISCRNLAVSPIRSVLEPVAEVHIAVVAGQITSPQTTAETGELPPPHSVDSPRLNASGKVIFQGLWRSSSSPNIFNGGPLHRARGMGRSFSANVLVTPVLNVPVCSIRSTAKPVPAFGFRQLFQKNMKFA